MESLLQPMRVTEEAIAIIEEARREAAATITHNREGLGMLSSGRQEAPPELLLPLQQIQGQDEAKMITELLAASNDDFCAKFAELERVAHVLGEQADALKDEATILANVPSFSEDSPPSSSSALRRQHMHRSSTEEEGEKTQ